jgi:uncharacterized protein YcfJ
MTQSKKHMGKTQKFVLGSAAVIILMAGTAALASYMTQAELQTAETPQKPAPVASHQAQPSRQQIAAAQPACDDGNVLGYLAGGAAGGILGNQVGKGKGKTAATIGGTIGGAYVGGKYLPTRNATCK